MDCNGELLHEFYPGYTLNVDTNSDGTNSDDTNRDVILSSPQANNYVSNNIVNNDDSGVGEGNGRTSILNHEKCYLQGNLKDGAGQPYTSGDFYKSSSMIEDLRSYATTGQPENGNVCGQGQYIYTDINPSTGETIEECQTCGTPPPGKENIDYNITKSIITDEAGFRIGTLKVREENGDTTTLGDIPARAMKDFEQDYTMYRYGIANQEQLMEVTNGTGELKPNFDITERARAIFEEHGRDGTPANKLDRASFLDVQKQCSPLISDWFPNQHGRNIQRRRTEIFDTNVIDYEGTPTRRATDLLSNNPISIMDFFNREYNSLPELDGLEEHKITSEMLIENGSNSIINNIRILDVGPPIPNEQKNLPEYTGELTGCSVADSTVPNPKCVLIGTDYYYKTIPEELARAWIAKKLDSIRRASPLT